MMQARMQAMMQNLPPERRALMEQRMKGMAGAPQAALSLNRTGNTDRVGSWPCDVWQLQKNGKTIGDSCIASRSALTGGDELTDATHKAAAAAADVFASIPVAREAANRMALYSKADGFPVRTRNISGGNLEDEETVTSIERQSLPADQFAIPKGFTQSTMGQADD
jgi:hypothetical protein